VPDDVGRFCLEPSSQRKLGPRATSTKPAAKASSPKPEKTSKPKRSTHMVRPFGHRVTLMAAPVGERTANVQLAPRTRPGRMRALRRVWGGGQACMAVLNSPWNTSKDSRTPG